MLFDKRISYRNNRKASVEFELPEKLVLNLDEIEIVLKAYNDDDKYLRSIWFEVDGVGDYIGTHKIAPSQVRGEATVGSKQQKMWTFNLSNCAVTSGDKGTRIVDFTKILKKPGRHTITSWISTYEQYGPNSWVSVELILKHAI